MKQYSVHLTDNFVFDTDNKPIGSGGSSEVRKVQSSYRQKDVYALKTEYDIPRVTREVLQEMLQRIHHS